MSVRDQERRAQETMHRTEEVQTKTNRRMQGAVRQADEASLRAEEVRRRIEVGDIQPPPVWLERRLARVVGVDEIDRVVRLVR